MDVLLGLGFILVFFALNCLPLITLFFAIFKRSKGATIIFTLSFGFSLAFVIAQGNYPKWTTTYFGAENWLAIILTLGIILNVFLIFRAFKERK